MRPPRLAGVNPIQLGGRIADELEAVAALDQGEPLRHQALKLHGPHLGAVLLALARALGALVGIQVALDPVDAPVEHVHDRPQQCVQVRFQSRVGQRRDQRIEHIGEGALQLRGLGQRTRIGLIVVGAMGIERELFEKMRGGGHMLGNAGIVGEAFECHRVCSS